MNTIETDLLAPCYQPAPDELNEHAQDVYWSSEYVPDDDDLVPLAASPFTEWLCQLLQGR